MQRFERILVVVTSGLLAALTAFVFLWNLGASSVSLYSDEVIYVRVTQGILHDGAWFPLHHGKPTMFEKPPLKFWLGAIAPWVLGESNFSFRLLDGLLGIGAVVLTVLLSRRIFHSIIGALVVGFLTLGMPEWVLAQHGFRRAVLDGLLTVLTLGTAWYAWRVVEASSKGESIRRSVAAIAALCSLAVLTKSVAGFVPLVVAGVSIAAVNIRILRFRVCGVLLVPIVLFALYVGCVAWAGGVKGLSIFLGVEILQRTFSGFQGHSDGSPLYYAWYLLVRGGGPPRLLLALGIMGAGIAARKDPRFRFLLVWSVVPVALYSCAASRVPWYISPFLPFCCMLAVFGSSALWESVRNRVPWSRCAGVVAAAVVFFGMLPYGRAIARNVKEVRDDTARLDVDRLMEGLRASYVNFTIVGNSLSGRSNPHKGRFNVEGIYREMLRPNLTSELDPRSVVAEPSRVFFVKEDDLSTIPAGWMELGRAAPFSGRPWSLVAVVYGVIDSAALEQ
jgi:4-amino-4-deoxy-L-arabinose transferase-like glycosyltransferase